MTATSSDPVTIISPKLLAYDILPSTRWQSKCYQQRLHNVIILWHIVICLWYDACHLTWANMWNGNLKEKSKSSFNYEWNDQSLRPPPHPPFHKPSTLLKLPRKPFHLLKSALHCLIYSLVNYRFGHDVFVLGVSSLQALWSNCTSNTCFCYTLGHILNVKSSRTSRQAFLKCNFHTRQECHYTLRACPVSQACWIGHFKDITDNLSICYCVHLICS